MPPFYLFLLTPIEDSSISENSEPMPSSMECESFSFSWLIGAKPSLEIDIDQMSIHRTSSSDARDFDFGLPGPHSPVLAHADEIFSDGLLLPLHVIDQPKNDSTSESFISLSNRYQSRYRSDFSRFHSVQGNPISRRTDQSKRKLHFFRNYAKKCLCFFLPWCRKVRTLRSITSKAERISPSTGSEFSSMELCRSDNFSYESAIHEAILHCKNSIAQDR